jgi:hypothetical protein
MGRVSQWPTVGARVVVWFERPPSSTPREPHEGAVDHVVGRTFTVAGLEATFNCSSGRSKPVRHGAGAFGSETYVAVDADSERAHQVLDTAARRDRDAEATRAVHAWLTLHAARVVIVRDELDTLPALLGLAGRIRRTIVANLAIAATIVAVLYGPGGTQRATTAA